MVNWKQKLSSRKFWVLCIVLLTCILTMLGFPESEITRITAVATAGADVIVYILAEGAIDARRVKNEAAKTPHEG